MAKKNIEQQPCNCSDKYIDALKEMTPIIERAYKCGEMNSDDVRKLASKIKRLGLSRDSYLLKYA